jgi:geranylgeranyl diphosphate synthase type II
VSPSETVDHARLTREDLISLRTRINDRLEDLYIQGPELLVAPVRYVLSGEGKRLRPILTLLTARACGGTEQDALPAAVAVECLHNFTLVHDDIMDRDDTRHGQPTVHRRWDDRVAILSGDALFALALTELCRAPRNRTQLTEVFARGALAVCEGQALDLDFESRTDVKLPEYLAMIDLKTGFMLGLSAELGALAADASPEQIEGVRRFGRLLGRAFQIQDDLLEVFSDAETMGKSLGSDLLAEKKTYLIVAARARAPEKVDAALTVAKRDLRKGLAQLREVLVDTGVRSEAENMIAVTISRAYTELAPLGAQFGNLQALGELVLNRDR